ncbi:MAG: hypothetical protein AAGA91_14880 [Pseudomonadota bacterium]
MRYLAAVVLCATLVSCGTTDSALREQGNSESYIQGFHDGRHSGMKEEGNPYEQYIRDEVRFADDADYRSGWLDGEAEGKTLQDQAVTIGNAAAGAYSGSQTDRDSGHDMDDVARDAVKGVDTTGLETLGQ